MGGKAKIETLTNTWYGFAVLTAIYSVLMQGIGFFSIAFAGFWLLVSWIMTFFFGRALVNKSSVTRAFLLLVSGLFTVLGAVGSARMAWVFVNSWQLSTLLTTFYTAVACWMHARSFRTLTDPSVKAYFG